MLDQWVAQKIPTENRPPPDIPEKRSPGAAGAATGEKEKGIYSQKNNSPNLPENARERLAERELLEATRAVAIAKFKEYRLQASGSGRNLESRHMRNRYAGNCRT
jgi:hypothetical protein